MAKVGALNCDDYVLKALMFLTEVAKASTNDCTRTGGEAIRYDSVTQEFGVFSPDGFLVTYFKPDPAIHKRPTNLAYFQDECNQP